MVLIEILADLTILIIFELGELAKFWQKNTFYLKKKTKQNGDAQTQKPFKICRIQKL